jgi:hypothetical protein
MRDPGNRRIAAAVLLKFCLLAVLWWVFIKDAAWTPSATEVGEALLSSAPHAADPVREQAP